MAKRKKTPFWARVRNAARVLRGRPATYIPLGIEFKRCATCDRGDCENCYYKRKFERWVNLPQCNDCLHNQYSSCGYCPAPGEDVRINCPLWKPKKEADR